MTRHARVKEGFNFVLDSSSRLSLQRQVRQRIVDCIHRGVLRPARRMPSSRALAARLGVSRNTVSLAYDALLAEGFLVSRARSGVFVAPDPPRSRIAAHRRVVNPYSPLASRLPAPFGEARFRCPANWHQYPYPFLDGRIGPDLLPLAEWREAMRLACARQDAAQWNAGTDDADDAMLLEELRSKVLPVRGIDAGSDELLVLTSQRHALHLSIDLLVRKGTAVVVEEPCDEELHRQLADRQAEISVLDPELGRVLPQGAIVVTSARRFHAALASAPGRLLAAVAAAEGVLIELDPGPEVRDGGRQQPSLFALDGEDRVIYIGHLAAAVSSGEPPGLLVADAAFIERARELRRHQGVMIAPPMQRSWAYFIGLGHYSAGLARNGRILERRRDALRDALNHYMHESVEIHNLPGTSAYWVSVPPGFNARELAQAAAAKGVLLELVEVGGSDVLLMGVTGLNEAQIRAGVHALASITRRQRPAASRGANEAPSTLRGRALRETMAGVTLLYDTVYGEPCTLCFHRNGEMSGTAGYANEDSDSGRWWIEGDHWFRQWQRWAYGEISSFSIVVDGDQMHWYDDAGLLADSALIVRKPASRRKERA
ncbi:MAG: PLP-dependent aminotransferase family protein [Proteobacteria bacterium]|uniref:PLP-dependent aminotransferase family protein n=1 Tax=Rudaea sp. TaxID=2136325 RepID=UPI0037849C71|nr:PLP-dependent aminotransferase family protein [Pseudomonadota bacterium]